MPRPVFAETAITGGRCRRRRASSGRTSSMRISVMSHFARTTSVEHCALRATSATNSIARGRFDDITLRSMDELSQPALATSVAPRASTLRAICSALRVFVPLVRTVDVSEARPSRRPCTTPRTAVRSAAP